MSTPIIEAQAIPQLLLRTPIYTTTRLAQILIHDAAGVRTSEPIWILGAEFCYSLQRALLASQDNGVRDGLKQCQYGPKKRRPHRQQGKTLAVICRRPKRFSWVHTETSPAEPRPASWENEKDDNDNEASAKKQTQIGSECPGQEKLIREAIALHVYKHLARQEYADAAGGRTYTHFRCKAQPPLL
jgi:hypothetical protein